MAKSDATYGKSSFSVEHVEYDDGDKTRTREIDRNTFDDPPRDPCFEDYANKNENEKKAAWKRYLEDKTDALDRALGEEDHLPGVDVTDEIARRKAGHYGDLNIEQRPEAIDRVRKQIQHEFKNLTYKECQQLLDSAGWKSKHITPWSVGGIIAAVLLIAGAAGTGYYFGSSKPASKTPGRPKNIKASPVGGGRVEVSWEPADDDDTQDKADSYEIVLSGANSVNTVEARDIIKGTVFSDVANGSYTVTVTAINAAGRGEAVTSAAFNVKDITEAPGAPTSVVAAPTGASSIITTWNAPQGDSNPAASYNVAVIDSQSGAAIATQTDVTELNFTHGNLPPGTYTITVTAVNMIGDSASVSSAPVTLAAPNEDDPLDWNTVINSEVVQFWRKRFDQLRDKDEDTFWYDAMAIVDPHPLGTNVRSYSDQLLLAKFLLYITLTPELPDASSIEAIAARIRAAARPVFPDGKMNPEMSIYARPLWKATKELRNDMGTMPEIRRYKLAGLVRVLEVYLGKTV